MQMGLVLYHDGHDSRRSAEEKEINLYDDDPSSGKHLVYCIPRINAGIGCIVIGLFLSDVEDPDCH